MNKNRIEIIDSFTQLMVYTLEFHESTEKTIYTLEKLVEDYEKLINRARDNFKQKKIDIDFNEALFPFVAWIDETILSSDFQLKKQWKKNLLQKKFFNTSNAGSEFYESLDELDQKSYDLRLLYLYCLFLGFRGKYYKDKEKIATIFEEQKSLLHDNFSHNFPQLAFKSAYAENPSLIKKKFSASYKGLWFLIGVSLAIGLVAFLGSQAHLNGMLDKYDIFKGF